MKTEREPIYTKQQLMEADEFLMDKDIINILLPDDGTSTKSKIRKAVNDYRNKEVG